MPIETYTIEQAEEHIAQLRGQVDKLSEILAQNDGPIPNAPTGSGLAAYSASGQLKYVSTDGSTYNTGCLPLYATSPTPVTSTSAFTLLSCTVGAGLTYRFDGIVRGTQGPNAAGQFVRFDGPAASFGIMFT